MNKSKTQDADPPKITDKPEWLVYGKVDQHGKVVFEDGRKFNLNRLPPDCRISIPAVEMGR